MKSFRAWQSRHPECDLVVKALLVGVAFCVYGLAVHADNFFAQPWKEVAGGAVTATVFYIWVKWWKAKRRGS